MRSSGRSSRTSTTGMSFCTCRTTCSTGLEVRRTTMVMRENSGFSVGPTVSEAMLYPRRENSPEMRCSTPGLFSTMRLMVWVVPLGFSSDFSMSVLVDHVVEGGARRDHGEHLLLAPNPDVDDGRAVLVCQGLVDDLVQLGRGAGAQPQRPVGLGQLDVVGAVGERRLG